MDEQSKKILEDICKREPQELNEENYAFLKARFGYLTDEQKAKYFTPPEPEAQTEQTENQ